MIQSKIILATTFHREKSAPAHEVSEAMFRSLSRTLAPNIGLESIFGPSGCTLSYNTVLSNYPNQSFTSAIDITRIREISMLMDRRGCAENQAMLDDEEAFMALSGKLIGDLIDKEPDTGRLPDVKVRFK